MTKPKGVRKMEEQIYINAIKTLIKLSKESNGIARQVVRNCKNFDGYDIAIEVGKPLPDSEID